MIFDDTGQNRNFDLSEFDHLLFKDVDRAES